MASINASIPARLELEMPVFPCMAQFMMSFVFLMAPRCQGVESVDGREDLNTGFSGAVVISERAVFVMH